MLQEAQAHLVPCFVQHNRSTNRNAGLVGKEALECVVVVVAGMLEVWANVEQTTRELLEGHCGETGVFFPKEVFIVPMSR